MPDPTTFDTFIRKQGKELRSKDFPPISYRDWEKRRDALRKSLTAALGTLPSKPTDLTPKLVRTIKHTGYRIELLLLQTRPDVWMTASAYVPENVKGKVPAVLVVHGHWSGARRDPVVQARCLGLVKYGFFVLAVDAFGAGERHPTVPVGGYHGSLVGSTLWPAGMTLLGMQVYENHRAVDYLLTRPEVDGKRLGITGASGGGNQTMYAGALDERFSAVVPVCSVGNYQAYLRAACCVCEVLPGALRFTEEGDVLGLVAPRALMVINATRDAFQFSVPEARKSLERANAIYKLHTKEEKVKHVLFESPHAYSRPMREAMYGWMTRWLKSEGKGTPLPEQKHDLEKIADLTIFTNENKRPKEFLFPPKLAHDESFKNLDWHRLAKLDHKEAWDAHSTLMKLRLEESLGPMPELVKPEAKWGKSEKVMAVTTTPFTMTVEKGLDIAVSIRHAPERGGFGKVPACIVLHLDGREAALKHPITAELVKHGRVVYAVELRATGEAQPKGDAIAGALDHNSAEHALWIGRPLLGQWVADVRAVLAFMGAQPGLNKTQLSLVGIGQAGVVALVAGAMLRDDLHGVAAIDTLSSYRTEHAYRAGTRMGLLAPGILNAGDIPHLSALIAPKRLAVAGAFDRKGTLLDAKGIAEEFTFAKKVYDLHTRGEALMIRHKADVSDLVKHL